MIGFGVCLCIGLIVGFIIGILYRRKQFGQMVLSERGTALAAEERLDDVLRLANVNIMGDLSALVAEHKMAEHMPGFYENFQHLLKQGQDDYYTELWHILSGSREETLQKLQDCGLKLSTQDLILLLLCGLRRDNKTIAHIMGIHPETLKKRKTRLKSKFSAAGLDFETFMGGGVSRAGLLAEE